ncbi:MAG: AraC family transcriptional regulator [Pseudomonadales bacterium]|nr:AraC family transcriptional regulator [Pseudomonadales bacterium]
MEYEAFDMPIRYLASVVDTASEHGIDLNTFLKTQGLEKESLTLPEATVKADIYFKAIALCQKQYKDETPFSLEVVRHTTLTNHGLLSLAGMCAPNYRASLELIQDYSNLILPAISFSLHADQKNPFVRIQSSFNVPDIIDTLMEIILGFFYAGKILTGIPPRQVTLAHTPASPIKYYEDFWDCPVLINQPHYELHIESHILDTVPPTVNPENFALLKRQLQEQFDSDTKISKLRLQIEKRLLATENGDFQTLEQMADDLHISPRTLRRKLEKENCTYKQLVNGIKERMAKQQLKKPDIPIGKVASHLGFSTIASFSRAFKSWTGQSPQEFRQKG